MLLEFYFPIISGDAVLFEDGKRPRSAIFNPATPLYVPYVERLCSLMFTSVKFCFHFRVRLQNLSCLLCYIWPEKSRAE